MKIVFITLFPETVLPAMRYSILGRAEQQGLVTFEAVNPRDFAPLPHRKVDDSPFGGGPGMVMKPEPLCEALDSLNLGDSDAVIFTDPTGDIFEQESAQSFATEFERLVFVCGHYEGIDERVAELFATHIFSIGDYVLTGGELPAMVMADAVVRLIPGALGKQESLSIDSFSDGLLSAPQYTRPEEYRGLKVPPVLLSGHHKKIEEWKREQSIRVTLGTRPELLNGIELSKFDRKVLKQISEED